MILQGCLSTAGPKALVIIRELTMDTLKCQAENLKTLVRQQKIKKNVKHDNYQNHKIIQQSSHYRRRFCHSFLMALLNNRKRANLINMESFCKEECNKIATYRCVKLVDPYSKVLHYSKRCFSIS